MGKRVISRRRGSGTGRYRSPSHRHHGAIYHPPPTIIGEGTVTAILPAPGRSAPVAEVLVPQGSTIRILATAGLATGDTVAFQEGKLDRGSILPLAKIPDGTLVSNLEVKPFDGGRLVRTAGTSALVVAHSGSDVTVQLPSGAFKLLLATCRAQVGAVGGGGRKERPIIKAGKKDLGHPNARPPAVQGPGGRHEPRQPPVRRRGSPARGPAEHRVQRNVAGGESRAILPIVPQEAAASRREG